ncbi:MAG: hypothetical protein IJY08_00005 [Clostridia bacterium]|nr:hypothetical protein [Clostridia bacterium]
MGRNHKNITIQLNKRIDELLRIGEKKVKVNGVAEGIHSVKTAEQYRNTANRLSSVCKEMGIKNIEDIDKSVVARYMEAYRDASSWTVSRELSAISKIRGETITPKELGFTQRRTYTSVKNSRGELPKSSSANRPQNQDALYLASVCGCRRSSLDPSSPTAVTANDAVRNEHGQIYAFHLLEKGGKERHAIVLPSEQRNLTNWVDNKLKSGLSPDAPLISHIDKNMGSHRMRAEYARELYNELKEAKERGIDVYEGRKYELFIDRSKYDYGYNNPRFKSDTPHNFQKDLALEVSFNLGHGRLDVSLYSYLIR